MGTSRGSPGSAGMVTQGFGGLFHAALQEVRRVIRYGGNGVKRVYDIAREIIVWMKLIRVNDEKPDVNISGMITVKKKQKREKVVVESFSSRVRHAWEDIKVTVKRHR